MSRLMASQLGFVKRMGQPADLPEAEENQIVRQKVLANKAFEEYAAAAPMVLGIKASGQVSTGNSVSCYVPGTQGLQSSGSIGSPSDTSPETSGWGRTRRPLPAGNLTQLEAR